MSSFVRLPEDCVEKLATMQFSRQHDNTGWRPKLPEHDLVIKTGLTPIVKEPTRRNNCLDRIFVSDSELCYTDVKVVNSAIKSDHKAIIAYSGVTKVNTITRSI